MNKSVKNEKLRGGARVCLAQRIHSSTKPLLIQAENSLGRDIPRGLGQVGLLWDEIMTTLRNQLGSGPKRVKETRNSTLPAQALLLHRCTYSYHVPCSYPAIVPAWVPRQSNVTGRWWWVKTLVNPSTFQKQR